MKSPVIVGGIGPESTIEYYRFILDGYRARVTEPSSLQIENLRARFRIKIRRGKCGLQIRHESHPKSKKHESHLSILTA